jgi:hypothetical protein
VLRERPRERARDWLRSAGADEARPGLRTCFRPERGVTGFEGPGVLPHAARFRCASLKSWAMEPGSGKQSGTRSTGPRSWGRLRRPVTRTTAGWDVGLESTAEPDGALATASLDAAAVRGAACAGDGPGAAGASRHHGCGGGFREQRRHRARGSGLGRLPKQRSATLHELRPGLSVPVRSGPFGCSLGGWCERARAACFSSDSIRGSSFCRTSLRTFWAVRASDSKRA